MHRNVRAGLGVSLVLASVLGLGGAALADGGSGGNGAYPSQDQVDRARAEVAQKKGDVAGIRAELARAQARADSAAERAEIASEAYNGAMWRLSQARKAAHRAAAAARAARHRVTVQRDGIARLVVRSYQEGTSFNTVTALLGAEGPAALMNRSSVADMAGDSMRADYDRYTRLSDRARTAEEKAAEAERAQTKVADQARAARSAAGAAAEQAQSLAGDVASRRDSLIHALAKAEHTSVSLASQRQAALEEIARKKAEAEARRRAAAAAKKAREEAAKRAREQQQAQQQGQQQGGASNGPSTPPASPPAPSAGGAAAAIAFAEAQLGEPYLWAAAGPDRWDCSGLTMMSWRAGGISLPHFSGAQYDAGTPIPISSARPGDLLFWSYNGRPSGIHHVALYLGGGRFIEAPHTGSYVRYNSIYDWYPNFAVRL